MRCVRFVRLNASYAGSYVLNVLGITYEIRTEIETDRTLTDIF